MAQAEGASRCSLVGEMTNEGARERVFACPAVLAIPPENPRTRGPGFRNFRAHAASATLDREKYECEKEDEDRPGARAASRSEMQPT